MKNRRVEWLWITQRQCTLIARLDAYSLPKIDEMVNSIAKCKAFSIIDLRFSYYQVPVRGEIRPFTTFEIRPFTTLGLRFELGDKITPGSLV